MRERSREDLLALWGVGENSLARLETLLGREIPSRAAYWRERGLPGGVARVLVREGIASIADLGRLTRRQFLSFRGLGAHALRRCEKLLGRRLPFQRRGETGS